MCFEVLCATAGSDACRSCRMVLYSGFANLLGDGKVARISHLKSL